MPQVNRRLALAACAAASVCLPAGATAQPSAPRAAKWAIEVYAGAANIAGSTGGSAGSGFPAGAPFTTVAGRPSRVVPSWFFGDGAALLNDVLGQFAAAGGTAFPRIVPLDAALQSAGAAERGGLAFGARLSRDISRRLAIEISADRRAAGSGMNGGFADSLGAARDSFKSAFEGLLATVPATNTSVTSTLSTSEVARHQVQIGASLNWRVADRGKLGVYLTGGGGVAMINGGAAEATLTGAYTFRLLGTYTIAETDRVIVKMTPTKTAGMGLVGGGVTWAMSPRISIKADVRASLVAAGQTTTVRGGPSSTASSPTAVLPSLTSPSIQFSTQSGATTSLSGAASEITTFRASGWGRQIAATIAIVRRF